MEKIRVRVCTGTACFVMGASDILLLNESLPEDVRERVALEGAPCLGMCHAGTKGRAPFVSVNGEMIESATLPVVMDKVMEIASAEH